jgi:molecular chaperone GrpE
MDALEYLKTKKLINEIEDSFTIKKDESEYNLLDLLNEYKKESDDKYLRLLAEFDNYKKRIIKEKEDLISKTKLDTLNSILELNDELNISFKALDENTLDKIYPIISKLHFSLEKIGLKEIKIDTYNEDYHEVISVIPGDETKIIDVISKGYTLNDKVVRYPKVIIMKNEQ